MALKTTIIGYPRVGAHRELKKVTERYFKGVATAGELQEEAKRLRASHWSKQQEAGIDLLPVGDFSFYDGTLDTAVLLGFVPARYRQLGLSDLDTYFAMAHGYQGEKGDVTALSMKKWFNTNYHYLVPEIDDEASVELNVSKLLSEIEEAKSLGVRAKAVVQGPFTFLKLARFTGSKTISDYELAVANAYGELLSVLQGTGVEWLQIDEPYLVRDLDSSDIQLLKRLYATLLTKKGDVKVLLQTYFGDIRDAYDEVVSLAVDGVGLDFVEGMRTLDLIRENSFPAGKTLFAGVVNGKNIWRNNYKTTLSLLSEIIAAAPGAEVVVNTSCSLLHVPYTITNETKLPWEVLRHFSFAEEKLVELREIADLQGADVSSQVSFNANQSLFTIARVKANEAVRSAVAALRSSDFTRLPAFAEREKIQKEKLRLPLFPTTTIGSFPQTLDVRENRKKFKKGEISQQQYDDFNKRKIAECVALQEQLGLDVLVHGEFERNDMVEYFGDNLDGYVFTENAWVQSYGTRCVKPPVVWGDISRREPITVATSVYAQSLTDRPLKGMLTGPVTILNWSFPREDVSRKEQAFQIALAIRDEVLDLEKAGIRIIQIDEAALREKLPLRVSDWQSQYLDWAIPAFRLVHSGVRPETQIHTHMCYSEFNDIITAIDDMDADVITFEASRGNLLILAALKQAGFRTEVGPGVYDIHSPRVPSVEEIEDALRKMLQNVEISKLWVNPDCGLKTRGEKETIASLRNLVEAARALRREKSHC